MTTNIDALRGAGNQRRSQRCSNGNIVSFVIDPAGTGLLRVSADEGQTWTTVTADLAGATNGSIFVDESDNLFVVWKQSGTGGGRTDGYLYLMRGAPDAARTSWTFGPWATVYANAFGQWPDLVVHREGTGWVAHIVANYLSGSNTNTIGNRVTVAADGTFTVGTAFAYDANSTSGYGTFPSIDFHHTGDGKTVKDSAPHIFVAWSKATTSSAGTLRFMKATYSAGSWTQGADQQISGTFHLQTNDNHYVNCIFDGKKVVIGGMLYNGSQHVVGVFTRDVADTTTATLVNYVAGTGTAVFSGSMVVDKDGHVYLFGRGFTGHEVGSVGYIKYDAVANAVSTWTFFADNVNSTPFVSTGRRPFGGVLDLLYMHGNEAPFQVRYDRLTLADLTKVHYSGFSYGSRGYGNSARVIGRTVKKFSLTGAEQTFVVPDGVTSMDVELAGGCGEHINRNIANTTPGPTRGGVVRARIEVTPGETLRLYVGGAGQASSAFPRYNGGGMHGTGDVRGGSGGGASDIRRGTTLNDRIVVAGGAGGDGGGSDAGEGGLGGGLTGGNATENNGWGGTDGLGGTQTAGGAGHAAGTFGAGATGSNNTAGGGGGGGGGWYGGGSGGNSGNYAGPGGGGGSSYTIPAATAVEHIQGGGPLGDGYITLSYAEVTAAPAPAPAPEPTPTVTSDITPVTMAATASMTGNITLAIRITPVTATGRATMTANGFVAIPLAQLLTAPATATMLANGFVSIVQPPEVLPANIVRELLRVSPVMKEPVVIQGRPYHPDTVVKTNSTFTVSV